MKPNWEDAPKGAKYLAMDEDGTWNWYAKKPTRCNLPHRTSMYVTKGRFWHANSKFPEWEKSVEKRPTKRKKQ